MKKSNFTFKLLLVCISLSLCVIAGEVLVRTTGVCATWWEKNRGKYVSPYAEPPNNSWYCGWTPNVKISYGHAEFDYPVVTNSFGFRDVEPPLAKPANEFRIITLGDSFTEGVGAECENSYPKWLERILRKKYGAASIRVINGGASGSDPFYSFTVLRDKLLPYEPDLVTVAMNTSDITDIIARGGEKRFLKNGRVRFVDPPKDEWLFARSHLYRFILINVFGYDWFGLSPNEAVTKRDRAAAQLCRVAQNFQTLAVKKNFALLVILHPANQLEALEQKYPFNADMLKQNLEAHQIQYVDLMPAFAGPAKMGMQEILKYYWAKDMHNNAEGYKILAEGIAAFILDKKFCKAF